LRGHQIGPTSNGRSRAEFAFRHWRVSSGLHRGHSGAKARLGPVQPRRKGAAPGRWSRHAEAGRGTGGSGVFEDLRVGLTREPFAAGASLGRCWQRAIIGVGTAQEDIRHGPTLSSVMPSTFAGQGMFLARAANFSGSGNFLGGAGNRPVSRHCCEVLEARVSGCGA
jgi:hypothetical protein